MSIERNKHSLITHSVQNTDVQIKAYQENIPTAPENNPRNVLQYKENEQIQSLRYNKRNKLANAAYR